jgi:hypothetical protein
MAVTAALILIIPDYNALLIWLLLFGAATAANDVAVNAQAAMLEVRMSRPIMGSVHGSFSLLIFSKNMTTDSLLVRYIFKVVIGEYWDGTKEVERGGEEAVASWADAAKGQGLRRGCAGGGRGAPDRIHMEGVA